METVNIGNLPRHWFFRGMLLGAIVIGACNALSYFYYVRGWGSLLGGHPDQEGIGVPLQMWYGGAQLDKIALWVDIGVGLILGGLLGSIAAHQSARLNQMLQAVLDQQPSMQSPQPFQFSLSSLMVATVPIALLFAAARTERSEVLGAIYILGPGVLVLLAMLPKNLSWQSRVILLTPMALALIGFAIWIAARLNIAIDFVMLGIYVCWVPQCVVAIVVLLTVGFGRALSHVAATE